MKLLEIKDLHTYFTTRRGVIKAVNGVSLSIESGKTLGVVGESGSGKSQTAMSILQLFENNQKIHSGEIYFEDREISHLTREELYQIRGNSISMIFQDPMTALNPVLPVDRQIAEVVALHEKCSKPDAERRALEMLELVGISADRAGEYPHQFSGGMKQRVVIALALACSPRLLLADEPTTALDVTIQAQVLDLIKGLKDKFNTAMILITHDLGVVAQVCDKVAVIYAGRIVESGTLEDVYDNPSHPYTKGLFAALPDLDNDVERLSPIDGLPPDPSEIRDGCDFKERCPHKCHGCDKYDNEMIEISPGHYVRCWRNNKGE